ncbi:MAG: S-layer homology domain-containing protein [Patescibacteria group bacterium]
MKRFVSLLALAAVFVTTAGYAFFDEVILLKQELQAWETTQAADFTAVVAQLDDITAPVFRDVPSEAWFNAYVSSLAEWGIVSGYRDGAGQLTGEFKPGNNVTIAEALKMAMVAAKVDLSACTGEPKNAEAAKHWAKIYVSCAEASGMRLFKGNVPSLNSPAKRAQVIAIINDAFGEEVLPLYSSFRDTAGNLWESDIAYAALLGIVSGDTDSNGNPTGYFRPDENIVRAETAKVIYEKIKDEVKATTL